MDSERKERAGTAAHYLGHGLSTEWRTAMHRGIWGQVILLASLVISGLVGATGLPRGAGVAEVEAAFPGRNGLIAFASNRAFPHSMDIYTITSNGNKVTRVTENVGNNQ